MEQGQAGLVGLLLVTMRRHAASSLVAASLLVLTTGCATVPDPRDTEAVQDYEEANDPAEPTMRAVFAFNQALDKTIVKPLARAYLELPDGVRESVHNFVHNIRTPVILLNDLLQGETQRAGTTVARVAINTTLGVGGLFDPAAAIGYRRHSEDFGQTLAVWGVDEGPYIVWPLGGPSNPRDSAGFVVDFLTDPLNLWTSFLDQGWIFYYGRTGVSMVDIRARNFNALDDLEKGSIDYYAAIRNFYRQRRNSDIANGDIDGAPQTNVDTGPRVR